jgi:hypothetical protein
MNHIAYAIAVLRRDELLAQAATRRRAIPTRPARSMGTQRRRNSPGAQAASATTAVRLPVPRAADAQVESMRTTSMKMRLDGRF